MFKHKIDKLLSLSLFETKDAELLFKLIDSNNASGECRDDIYFSIIKPEWQAVKSKFLKSI